jgi:hypothetical protein
VTDLDVRIVTTFNPREWGTFVRHNLESVLDFLPYEVVAYHEGEQPDLEHHRLVWRDLHDVPGADEFIAEAGRFPPARGQFEQYDYNFDAHKFARKVYAQCDAAEERGEILIWLDSDVEATGPLSVGQIENLMLGMPMARYARPQLYTETGIVFWDLRQSETGQFFRHYRHLYDSRRIYTLAGGWHDCWAMDAVIAALSLPTANLTRKHASLEVVSTSELGKVFRHDKGNRKYAAA